MLTPDFQVGRPVGTGRSRPNDVIRLRRALNETGHGSSPPDPSGVYDPSLIRSIERFQGDYGLKEDGIVLPGGPTARMLNLALAAQRQGGDEGQAQLRDTVAAITDAGLSPAAPPPGDERPIVFTDENGDVASPGRLAEIVGHAPQQSPDGGDGTPPVPAAAAAAGVGAGEMTAPSGLALGAEAGTASVGLTPAALGAATLGAAALLGIGSYAADQWGKAHPEYLARMQAERDAATGPISDRAARMRARREANGARRTIDAEAAPSILPGTPPNLPPHIPTPPLTHPPVPHENEPEQILPVKSGPEILKGPEIQEARPGIFVFPDLSGAFNDWMILERRRGDEKTRTGLEKVRDFVVENLLYGDPKDWKHIGGGRKKGTKEEIPEFWIPGPQKDFEREGETIDGRKGGKFVDLTFENERTGEMVHIQTVDTDKYGKPTERELNNAEIIRKRTGARVYLFAKDAIPQ